MHKLLTVLIALFLSSIPALSMDSSEKYEIEDLNADDLLIVGAEAIYYEDAGEFFSDNMVNTIKSYVTKAAHDNYPHLGCKQNSTCNYTRAAAIIFNALVNSKDEFKIMFNDLIKEIKYRLIAVSTYDKFLEKTSYNSERNDQLKLSKNWAPMTCQVIGDKYNEPIVNGAYVPSNNISYFDAIQECKNTDLILDCGSATMLHSYVALSDVIGSTFNDIFHGETFYVSTFNAELCDNNQQGHTIENPFFNKIVREVDIANVKEIIPGDIVYFQNYPNYAEKHPYGASSGEYAICVGIENGEPIFKGHGMDVLPCEKIYALLRSAFNRSNGKNGTNDIKPVTGGEEAKQMVNNSFPGISKTIYRFSYFRQN